MKPGPIYVRPSNARPEESRPVRPSPIPAASAKSSKLATAGKIIGLITGLVSAGAFLVVAFVQVEQTYCAREDQLTPIAQPDDPPTPQDTVAPPRPGGAVATPRVAEPEPAPPGPPPDQIDNTEVERTGGRGGDGTPEVNITVTFNNPIPAGYTGASVVLHTNRDWPGGWSPATPGSSTLVLERIFLHHSLDGQREYLQVTLEGDNVEPIVLRAPVRMR